MTCYICESINPERSHTQNARDLGVSEATIRRHRQASHLAQVDVPEISDEVLEEYAREHGIDPDSLDPYALSYNGPNGWVKYRVNKTVKDALAYEDIDFSMPDRSNVLPSGTYSGGELLFSSDWQIGKSHERYGGTPETIECIKRGFVRYAEKLAALKPAEAAMIDGGDIIEGIFNVPSQPFTNDLDLTAQIRTARRLFAEGIKMFAPLVPKLYVGAVPSNHGEVRTGKQARAGSSEADFGLDIHESLKEIFADREEFAHVEFIRPEYLHNTLEFTIANTKIAVNHGHTAGNGTQDTKWWAGQDHGRLPGWDADIMVLNHLHNLGLKQSGNERWIIRTSSADPGSAWHSDKTGEVAKRGQTTFSVRDGEWFNLGIL